MCWSLGIDVNDTVIKLACIAVVSFSFKPSGASARGHWDKLRKKVGAGEGGGAGNERKRFLSFPPPPAPTFLLLFAQCPRTLPPLGLKEKETTATQAIIKSENLHGFNIEHVRFS